MAAAAVFDDTILIRNEPDVWTYVWMAGATLAVAAGLLVWRQRPTSWMGALMVAWLLPGMLSDANLGFQTVLAQTVTFVMYDLGAPLFVAMLFAYPSGRIAGRAYWIFIWTFAVVAEALLVPAALFQTPDAECPRCLSTYFHVGPPPFDLVTYIRFHAAVVLFVMLPWFGWLVWRRVRSLSRGARRTAVPFYYGAAAPATTWLGENLIRLTGQSSWWGAVGNANAVALMAVPVLFAWGVLGVRRRRTPAVADLVVELGQAPPGGVREALARAVGDPSLTIALRLADRGIWVDDTGREVELPVGPDRAVTLVADGTAAVIHDPDLVDQQSLVAAAGSAARLALENERLHVEQLAQIDELQTSRARITTAADQERRRIERDLHDGAQQRLVGAGLALQLVQNRVRDDAADALVADAQVQVQEAIRELRELARGVYPAVLLDQGLAAALRNLADRSAVPVTVEIPQTRLPGPVEAAAYFITAEALTNTGKHAHATHSRVVGRITDRALYLCIEDDGVGGATATGGTGLQGMTDRAGALGGTVTITSHPGQGTRIEVMMPCGSS